MREAEAARTAPDATAAGLWHSLIIGTSGMVTNIPLAGACIEPAKSALFWINKVQSALAALPPETARDAATVTRQRRCRKRLGISPSGRIWPIKAGW